MAWIALSIFGLDRTVGGVGAEDPLPDGEAPVAVSDPVIHVVEDGYIKLFAHNGVLANDTDADDGDGFRNLTAELVSGPSHGEFVFGENGSLTYTPFPNYFGPDRFVYRASDGTHFSNPVTVEIQVDELVRLHMLSAWPCPDGTGYDCRTSIAPGELEQYVMLGNFGPSNATNVVVDLASIVPPGVTRTEPDSGTGSQWTQTIPRRGCSRSASGSAIVTR